MSSDPYLKIARMLEGGGRTYVFKTEVQRRNLNPQWRQIQVSDWTKVLFHEMRSCFLRAVPQGRCKIFSREGIDF